MLTLAGEGFDFHGTFPVPLHEARHRAACLGQLNQEQEAGKSATTEAELVALLHCEWCAELCVYHAQRAYLLACIKGHVDPGTGKRLRTSCTWPVIETRARAEVIRLDAAIQAIFSIYADHFGQEASDAFGAFVFDQLDKHCIRGAVFPGQRLLSRS
jgi:hypothetical protein